jgi:hypothetical protein
MGRAGISHIRPFCEAHPRAAPARLNLSRRQCLSLKLASLDAPRPFPVSRDKLGAKQEEVAMSCGVEVRPFKDANGGAVYRVTVSVGGSMSVVRDFKSKEDAERFAGSGRKRLAGGPKRA